MNGIVSSTFGRAFFAALVATVVMVTAPSQAQAQGVTVIIGGQPLYLQPGPVERAGRVFLPMRAIFERLGAGVVYDNGTINATKGRRTISLTIGSTRVLVDGQPEYLDVAPFIIGATTYVPVRFVSQSLGAYVDYNAQTRVVAIDVRQHEPYPAQPPPLPPQPPPAGPPALAIRLITQQPAPDLVIVNRFATVSADFSHRADPGSVRVWLDGNNITSRSNVTENGFSYRPLAPLEFGSHTVRVSGRGIAGLPFDRSWSFRTGGQPAPPPANPIQLRAQQPAPGTRINNRFATISAEFSRPVDPGSIRVLLDGNNIAGRSGVSANSFSYKPPAPLDFGSHTVRVTGRGAGGLAFDRSWSFTVNRTVPVSIPLTINQPDQNAPVGTSFVVQGNTVANGRVLVTAGASDTATGQFRGNTVAGPLGNFRLNVTLNTLIGQQAVRVKITATDPNSSQSTSTMLRLRLNQ